MQTLEGINLKIRAMEPSDIDLLYEWENDPETWQYSNTQTPFSRFHLEQYIINSHSDIYTDKQLRLMIIDENKNTVGCVDLFEFDPKNLRAGIGILIAKPFRKKGYASETLDIVIQYCNDILGLHQIFCNITQENQSSLKLFQSKGFEIIGLKKDWILFKKQWLNEYMLQLVF
jgi:diamine N-acetyltransferase